MIFTTKHYLYSGTYLKGPGLLNFRLIDKGKGFVVFIPFIFYGETGEHAESDLPVLDRFERTADIAQILSLK